VTLHFDSSLRGRLWIASVVAFCVAAFNVMWITILGGYDFHIGPLHLVAQDLFKPLLFLNFAFFASLAARGGSGLHVVAMPAPGRRVTSAGFLIAAAAITAAIYASSFRINLEFPDWTHRISTHGRGILSFFTERQYDGLYRPLTFISLWIDNRIFGDALWAYHAQNLLLHFLNAVLVARLALRCGLSRTWAQWAGILFVALPAAFEAVIWPGARFDLLATAFTLVAFERALAGSIVASAAAFALGVLSKESAYCYPLVLGAIYVWRARLGIALDDRCFRRVLVAAAALTAVLIAIRFAVYGNFGGFLDPVTGKAIQFVITPRSVTSLLSRVPASLYVVNSTIELALWMRAALLLYTAAISAAVLGGARLDSRAVLAVLPFLAAIPMLNMIGWVNHFAQQGRYLYQPGVWAIIAACWALSRARHARITVLALAVSMAAAAMINTSAYLRMLDAVDVATASAAAARTNSSCCRTLILEDVPANLYGAFYFRYQVWWDLQHLLPDVNIPEPNGSRTASPCTLILHWTAGNTWTLQGLDSKGGPRKP
jgi:hypothetical protein